MAGGFAAAGGGLLKNIMPWFAQSRDAADGRMRLDAGRLMLDWDVTASEDTMNAVTSMHRKLAFLTEGIPMTPLTWTAGRDLITPHPLEADGSIVPKALGLNPSRTIAALAEHIAAGIAAGL